MERKGAKRSGSKQLLAVVSFDREIIELAEESGRYIIQGIFDINPDVDTGNFTLLGSEKDWKKTRSRFPGLKVALALDPAKLKENAARIYGLSSLETIISSEAYVSPSANIGRGCLIQRGAKIMANACLGNACKINVNAVVHHDCSVGNYCTLAPGSMLLGKVKLADRVFIGAGAIILPGVHIGHDAIIGAGAVIIKDVPPRMTFAGVPGRELIKDR